MFKRLFHKFAYRVYLVGKAINDEKKAQQIPSGLSSLSRLDKVEIQDNVSFGGEVMILGGGEVQIGRNTMIGAGTIIHTSTHDYNLHPMNEKRIDLNVIIGQNVWIGAGAIIMPGVTVGSFAVVGAGSVVTRDVQEGTIVAGVPAKIIKFRPEGIY